jgi:hypothetical protein
MNEMKSMNTIINFPERKSSMSRYTVYMLALILCSSVFLSTSFGQSKTGTTIFQFLLIEPSARVTGMGNAGVTSYTEAISSYYNPAALGKLYKSNVQFTHNQWFADIRYDYATLALKVDESNTLSLNFTSLNSGEIDVRTVEQPLGTGERYTVSNIAIGIGYGRRLSDRFSLGLNVNYIQETIWRSSISTFALNFGTLYRLSEDGIHIGASISNFGMPARFSGSDLRIRYNHNPDQHGTIDNVPAEIKTDRFPLPVVFRVGIGYPVKVGMNNELLVTVNAYHPNDNTESVSFGAEWNFRNSIFLRSGYQKLFELDSEVGLTLGFGLHYEFFDYDVRFDYAWADHGRLGASQRFTLGLAF